MTPPIRVEMRRAGGAAMIARTRARLGWGRLLAATGAIARPPGDAAARIASFEERFGVTFGFAHAVAVSSVRFGLARTLAALALPPGSEVLCTPISLAPVLDVVRAAGLAPVFVDVSRTGFSPDLAQAAARCGARTRAMLVTHLWGLAADGPALDAFCRERGLVLLEDGSQALGACVRGRPAGGFGRAGLFSFSPTKTINCFHGAMLVTADAALAARIRAERDALPPPSRGRLARYLAAEVLLKAAFDRPLVRATGAFIGAAHRLGLPDHRRATSVPDPAATARSLAALACGFGAVQADAGLATLADHVAGQARRRAIAAAYRAALAPRGLAFGEPVPESESGDWVTVAFHGDALGLRRRLWRSARIDTTTPSLDLVSALLGAGDATPRAADLLAHALYLPNHPELDDVDVARVIGAVSLVL